MRLDNYKSKNMQNKQIIKVSVSGDIHCTVLARKWGSGSAPLQRANANTAPALRSMAPARKANRIAEPRAGHPQQPITRPAGGPKPQRGGCGEGHYPQQPITCTRPTGGPKPQRSDCGERHDPQQPIARPTGGVAKNMIPSSPSLDQREGQSHSATTAAKGTIGILMASSPWPSPDQQELEPQR